MFIFYKEIMYVNIFLFVIISWYLIVMILNFIFKIL